jgi:hypothetical protein
MEYDFAIIYFGLTRTLKATHESHKKYIFDNLKKNNLNYMVFLHTWEMKNGIQNIWEKDITERIDSSDYKLVSPDVHRIDDEDEFLKGINMDTYFYKDVWEQKKTSEDGEWIPKLVSNYICMLESQKRGFNMVMDEIKKGNTFKFIMFIRPDIEIFQMLPIDLIIYNKNTMQVPNHSHYSGINDQFAIMNYEYACIYSKRIDELADFRKKEGRIVAEKYCAFIISKYNMDLQIIPFDYIIVRPISFS